MNAYAKFLDDKMHLGGMHGFEPADICPKLFDFQQSLVDWSLRKGRAAIFADCGLGKTPMQLEWAHQIVCKTNGNVLVLTPLAVAPQTIEEGEKFGIECKRSGDGTVASKITVANYERLHHFNSADFVGCVADESSILKSFDGVRRAEVTEFMRKLPYRLLCTATAAPNDYIELGTSSEALGDLGYMDMLTRFFKNDQGNTIKTQVFRQGQRDFRKLDDAAKWRFKGHAEQPFWRWVCSWARAIRKPSDLGFDDGRFILPPLIESQHVVEARSTADGMLFALPAVGLKEQREERRRTINERCEMVASIVNRQTEQSLVWCHLNQEGDLLENLMPDAVQISGDDSDERKEEAFTDFAHGRLRVLVTKPKIGAWGLNFQTCAHITFFPSHSFEQYYQGVRRCWRFGQTRPVRVDVITTEGEQEVMKNLQRKAAAADKMFADLVAFMNQSIKIDARHLFNQDERMPSWL